MSRYTYAGRFINPTESWFVKDMGDHFEIWVRSEREADGSCEPDRPHTKGLKFDEWDDACDYIQQMAEFFEQDYDEYLEENHDAIVQMERYEDFMNER